MNHQQEVFIETRLGDGLNLHVEGTDSQGRPFDLCWDISRWSDRSKVAQLIGELVKEIARHDGRYK